MRDAAIDPSAILDDVLGPEGPTRPATSPSRRSVSPPEPTELRDLMAWVSREVFGPAA
jgi:hypothetical protein